MTVKRFCDMCNKEIKSFESYYSFNIKDEKTSYTPWSIEGDMCEQCQNSFLEWKISRHAK